MVSTPRAGGHIYVRGTSPTWHRATTDEDFPLDMSGHPAERQPSLCGRVGPFAGRRWFSAGFIPDAQLHRFRICRDCLRMTEEVGS